MTQAALKANDYTAYLMTSEFLQNIKAKVDIALNKTENADDLPLAYTNYQALNSNTLLAIASQSLEGVDRTKALPDSSTLIFEVNADGTIRGFLNDQEYTPMGCSAAQACQADTFVAGIMAYVAHADVASACASEVPSGDDLAILN